VLGIFPIRLALGLILNQKRKDKTPGKVPSRETGTKQPRVIIPRGRYRAVIPENMRHEV
jgi:hypothetical protein